jgi:hypothetical protein
MTTNANGCPVPRCQAQATAGCTIGGQSVAHGGGAFVTTQINVIGNRVEDCAIGEDRFEFHDVRTSYTCNNGAAVAGASETFNSRVTLAQCQQPANCTIPGHQIAHGQSLTVTTQTDVQGGMIENCFLTGPRYEIHDVRVTYSCNNGAVAAGAPENFNSRASRDSCWPTPPPPPPQPPAEDNSGSWQYQDNGGPSGGTGGADGVM